MSVADSYRLLGVDTTASLAQVKKAFRQKALELHPDQGGDDAAFRDLKDAFEQAVAASLDQVEQVRINSFAGRYDPFTDPNYHTYTFFAPEHDAIAEFERSVRAKDCPFCNGLGKMTKATRPQDFMSVEDRFCICQRIG